MWAQHPAQACPWPDWRGWDGVGVRTGLFCPHRLLISGIQSGTVGTVPCLPWAQSCSSHTTWGRMQQHVHEGSIFNPKEDRQGRWWGGVREWLVFDKGREQYLEEEKNLWDQELAKTWLFCQPIHSPRHFPTSTIVCDTDVTHLLSPSDSFFGICVPHHSIQEFLC